MKKKTYIIAEVGPNHQGSLKIALEYIKKLSLIGVDAVKFQIGIPDEIYSESSFKPNYQKKFNEKDISIKDLAKKRLLNLKDHIILYKACKKFNVDYLCSAFDLKSLKFLFKNTKLKYYKIASGEIHSLDMLEFLSKKNKPLIMSTGMANLNDIKKSIKIINKFRKHQVILLHCVSSYPTKIKDLNLRYISKLRKIFNCQIGFSDHTKEILPAVIATSLGAVIIEKHVTLNKKWKGPDHRTSLNLKEFKTMVKQIRKTEKILGQENKIISIDEKQNSLSVKKSCIAKKNLKKGTIIKKKHLCFKRPGNGISPLDYKKIINRKTKVLIKSDTTIKLSQII
jgi:N,N'-diacetyllegionaminate synthase